MTPHSITEWISEIVRIRKEKGFTTNWRNMPTKSMLVITEIGRAVDGHRKDSRRLVEHELIDGLVRYLDLLGSLGIDTQGWLERSVNNWKKRVPKHGKRY
jgi:hypothetical protein